jgi:glycosyltransferase involved in cell wall biosynthesis
MAGATRRQIDRRGEAATPYHSAHPMRILLSCYYFSPYRGGEAAVGWNIATRLAAFHEVTVLYGDLSGDMPMKADVERYRSEQAWPERLNAVHVASDARTRWIHDLHAKPGLFFLYYAAYKRWQQTAFDTACRLHQKQPFDLAHHLTIIGYREPGYLWRLGIPFFWGPINGAASIPWAFIKRFGATGRYRHLLRNTLNRVQMRLPSRSRKAAMAATKIWAVTAEDQHMVQDLWGRKAELMLETGATPAPNPVIRSLQAGETLRLVWCGIIEARKALDLAIEAIARLPDPSRVELYVVGDGPEQAACKALAERLQVQTSIRWHGRVSHAEAQQLMGNGHALIHTAVKEGTPHVVLEALAQGMPVLCHDACGMGVAVTDQSGIRISLRDPESSIIGFAKAIAELCHDPSLLTSLSHGALARTCELSWNHLVRRAVDAYIKI